jgi:type IV pilus assembly protein PilN
MIKVNLLATSPGAAPAREWLPREQRSALVGIALLVVTAAGIGGWWWYVQRQRTVLEAEIAAAETELVRLKDAAKLVERATARKTELAERLALIERLRAAKRGPVTLLETISRSLPDGLWLTDMKQSGAVVQFEGRATSLTSITDFAELMQNSGLFKRPVEILTTSNDVLEERAIVKFAIRAESEKPVDPVIGLPPAPAPAKAGAAPGAPGV